jgi:hypothetical protein
MQLVLSISLLTDVASLASYTDVTEGLADYLSSQSSIVPGVVSEKINGPQQHSTPSGSPYGRQIRTESINKYEEEKDNLQFTETEEMPVRGMLTGMPLPTGNRERKSNSRGAAKQGLNYSSNLISVNNSNDNVSESNNFNVSEVNEVLSDSRMSDSEPKVTVTAEIRSSVPPDKPKPPLPKKPSLKEQLTKSDNDSGMVDDGESTFGEKSVNVENTGQLSSSTSKSGPVEAFSAEETQTVTMMELSSASSVKRNESSEGSGSETKSKRSKKKQVLF